MTTRKFPRTDINAVFPTVAATMADALGCDVEDVKPNVSLIEDLDAESIDFLDMVFRLERAFKIKIPRGKIVENARGTLTEAEFEQKGIVTDAGLAQLPRLPVGGPGRTLQDADEGRRTSRGSSRRRRSASWSSRRSAKRSRPDEAPAVAAMPAHGTLGAWLTTSPRSRSSTASPTTSRDARARTLRGAGGHAGVSVVPRRRGRRAARRMGGDGAHRVSRPAGCGTCQRNAVSRRRRARQHARSRRRHRTAATTRGRLPRDAPSVAGVA